MKIKGYYSEGSLPEYQSWELRHPGKWTYQVGGLHNRRLRYWSLKIIYNDN